MEEREREGFSEFLFGTVERGGTGKFNWNLGVFSGGGTEEKPIKLYFFEACYYYYFLSPFNFCYNFYILFLAISIAFDGFYYSTML